MNITLCKDNLDNVTSWRPVTPSGQDTVSPFLRSGVLRAAYGARYGIIGTNRYLDDGYGFNLLFLLGVEKPE